VSVSRLVEFECGYQGSPQAAENALALTREFLAAVGALPAGNRKRRSDLPIYRLRRKVPKETADTYEMYASNFQYVPADSSFAAVDGEEITAEEGFYPVLMSASGYGDIFGYAAERLGTVESEAG